MRTFFLNLYDFLSQYFQTGQLSKIIFVIKIISAFLSFAFLVIFIILLVRLWQNIKNSFYIFSASVGAKDLPKKQTQKKWEDILRKIQQGDEDSYKMAVIEADKMFDDILVRIGTSGQDMGERLKQLTEAQISNLDEIWRAHKLRNSLVHDPDFELKRPQAEEAVRFFEKALKELQVL
jgi:hypothetical protein